MSIFDSIKSIFNNNTVDEDYLQWRRLSTFSDVKKLNDASHSKFQLIYKHSTRCATSYFALKNLQNFPEEKLQKLDLYIIDVISQRQLSHEISEYFKVRHESPQVIILKDGQLIWNASHGDVRTEVILKAINLN
ncbi:MAG: bacillithiol system redox-active protein YtxJ [Gracilimonas sp.]|nr:bacillithiol system redox-active protein YtxJ [Gracilimonas sp.]